MAKIYCKECGSPVPEADLLDDMLTRAENELAALKAQKESMEVRMKQIDEQARRVEVLLEELRP